MFRRISVCICVSLLFFGLIAGSAHAQKTPTAASTNLHVDAPLAQALVDRAMTQHSDIGKLGIHAVPPGASDNVIIACNIRSKNGKKSSPADLEKLAGTKPVAVRVEKEQIFDLLLPMTDAHGSDLDGGFVVMEVPFSKAGSEQEALTIGIKVRDELQAQIPNKAALYQR